MKGHTLGGNDTALARALMAQGEGYVKNGSYQGSKYEGGLAVPEGTGKGLELGGKAEMSARGIYVWKESSALAAGINLKGEAVGTDKIDHMFFDGYAVRDMTEEDARKDGADWENGGAGLKISGVYSNADIEANMIGRDFYRNLQNAAESGEDYIFDINNYDISKINENKNENSYNDNVKKQVQDNE